MVKEKSKCSKLASVFKSVDMYGKSVSLQIEGEESYKSIYGAVVSFMIICGVVALFIYNLVTVFKK